MQYIVEHWLKIWYFVMTLQKRNKVYSKILSLKPPNLIYTVSRSPAEMLRASGLTKVLLNIK